MNEKLNGLFLESLLTKNLYGAHSKQYLLLFEYSTLLRLNSKQLVMASVFPANKSWAKGRREGWKPHCLS